MASKRSVVEDFQARLRAADSRPKNHYNCSVFSSTQELEATLLSVPLKRGLDFTASSQSDFESEFQRQPQTHSSSLNFPGPNTSNTPMESHACLYQNLMGGFEAFLNQQRQQFIMFLKTVVQDSNSSRSEGGNPLINCDLKPSRAISHSKCESSQTSESESSLKCSNERNYITVSALENLPKYLSPFVKIERMNYYPASGGKYKSKRQACDIRFGHNSTLHSRKNVADPFESLSDFQCGVKTRSQKTKESIAANVMLGGGSKEVVAEEPSRLRSGRVMRSCKEVWVPARLCSSLQRVTRKRKQPDVGLC